MRFYEWLESTNTFNLVLHCKLIYFGSFYGTDMLIPNQNSNCVPRTKRNRDRSVKDNICIVLCYNVEKNGTEFYLRPVELFLLGC